MLLYGCCAIVPRARGPNGGTHTSPRSPGFSTELPPGPRTSPPAPRSPTRHAAVAEQGRQPRVIIRWDARVPKRPQEPVTLSTPATEPSDPQRETRPKGRFFVCLTYGDRGCKVAVVLSPKEAPMKE